MSSNLEPIPITSQKHDPAWKHCQMFKNGERVQLRCIYCGKIFKGGGIHRIKEHLAGHKGNAATCLRVPSDVRVLMQESLDGVVVKKRKKQKIADEITNVNQVSTETSTFSDQVDANPGVLMIERPDTVEPSSTLLVNREGTSNVAGERRKRGKGKSSAAEVNALGFPLVELGARRVNNNVHMAIGRFLFDIGATLDAVNSVYFQPMVDAVISGGNGTLMPSRNDLQGWILKKSVEEVKSDNEKLIASWARSITRFIYNHSVVLNMVRRYTFGNDIVELAATRSATNFTTLTRMVDLRNNLQAMITSQEWVDCPYSKKPGGLVMLDLVSDQSFWSSCVLIVQFFYSVEGDMPNEMLSGMLDCIEKLVPDVTVQDKISKEINSYKNAAGDFGRKMAVRARDTLLPAEWWSTYGGSCPNLARLAIRVLSQTCSTLGLKHNRIPFEKLHETRNCLEQQRVRDLIFVQCNLQLRQIGYDSKQQDSAQPISSESASIVEDWVMGTDTILDDDTYPDWTTLETLSVSTMLLRPPHDEMEELGAGFDDHEIFNRVKEGDDENAEDNARLKTLSSSSSTLCGYGEFSEEKVYSAVRSLQVAQSLCIFKFAICIIR
ncbi:hypothetical protein V6N12_014834 [Hibiscus sabdariffa]|uniref:BED-type domain-containing protein n=1 Tax=Hibiscus sabdariffa TaxID=183260 RepID=A0ABR2DLD3_9ROSI